jgi:exonuclease III
MHIKLATWNMAHWSHKNHANESWKYFTNNVGSDILLFQESVPNCNVLNKKNLVWSEIGGPRKWGSGIYSQKYTINPFPFTNNFPGAVIAAEIELHDNLNIIVISLYGLMEKISNIGYAIPNLHRIFSDLTEILEFKETKHRVVIGGDLNASLQIDEIQSGNSHRVFFDRLREFGLVNCFDNYFTDFVQTHRHNRSTKPWQNDYFFISKKLETKLVGCNVIDNEFICKYSDHNPVVIELDV